MLCGYRRFILLSLFFLLLFYPVVAILQTENMKIFAVTDDHKGIAADLIISTIPGDGKVLFITSNSLVGKDTQTTGNIALQIAQKKTNVRLNNFDLKFDIRANASEVDGPSAGAAMTIVVYSMLAEKKLSEDVALTGTINTDGSIGMVGGVGPKAQAAAKAGIKLFMIPTGEAVTEVDEGGSTKTVNLLEYAPKELGMKIVEVSTIDQAIEYAYSNIDEIQVDTNVSTQIFIPKSIQYSEALIPMKVISQSYIDDAKAVIDQAKKELEQSTIPDDLRGELYSEYSATKRNLEMAQRFLDQNYLYSSANYAFNSRVMASAIKEIAQNPSLLSSDSTLLNTKISALKEEIAELKKQCNFIPADEFEWLIGAQQRIAYAENALRKIESTLVVSVNDPSITSPQNDAEQAVLFEKVYDYSSAESWISVSKDFLKESKKSKLKKVPRFTKEFVESITRKIVSTEKLINDSNISRENREESLRRISAAKISFDNNFFFAAMYDAYFAESFTRADIERNSYNSIDLYDLIGNEISSGLKSDSIWANMFFDHAKFYYENASFNKRIGRVLEVTQSLETSYDLIFLSKKLSEAKTLLRDYISNTQMNDYSSGDTLIDVKYTQTTDFSQYLLFAILVLSVVLIGLIILLGISSRTQEHKFTYDSRKEKLKTVLNNLDVAFSQKKISDAEYFFMKKRYEDEIRHRPNIKEQRKRLNLSLEDLRAKQRALEKGLFDLKRHFQSGLIIPEDYERNMRQVRNEIGEIKAEIKQTQQELREERRLDSPISLLSKKIFGEKVKGTEELVDEEKEEEKEEKVKRKKVLKKFAYKKK